MAQERTEASKSEAVVSWHRDDGNKNMEAKKRFFSRFFFFSVFSPFDFICQNQATPSHRAHFA